MKLRDYQQECLNAIHTHFQTHNSQIIQLPTGAGKTVVFLSYIKQTGMRTLILCPTVDLVNQVTESANAILEHNIALITVRTFQSIYVSKIDTISREYDLIIVDEAHHCESKSMSSFIKAYQKEHKDIKILGVTATPERLDGKNILNTFNTLTFTRNVFSMIKDGYLTDLEAYRIKTNITFDDHIENSDFSITLLKQLDCESRNKLIYNTFKENCNNTKTLIFCINVDHANKIAEFFRENGVSASSIHGKLSKQERKQIIGKFREGSIQVLTNCQLLTEGFDEPSIEALIIARPTRSKALYAQMVGRGLRTYPGKECCYLYELTDNSHKICTFVSLHPTTEFVGNTSYKQGLRLSTLKDEIHIENLFLIKEKITLLDSSISQLTNKSIDENLLEIIIDEGI